MHESKNIYRKRYLKQTLIVIGNKRNVLEIEYTQSYYNVNSNF